MPAVQKLVRATVAQGRTIYAPHATLKQTIVGSDGKPAEVPAIAHHGPGSEVSLPEDEVKSLRGSGFLVDPKLPEATIAEGPTFSTQPTRIDAGE